VGRASTPAAGLQTPLAAFIRGSALLRCRHGLSSGLNPSRWQVFAPHGRRTMSSNRVSRLHRPFVSQPTRETRTRSSCRRTTSLERWRRLDPA